MPARPQGLGLLAPKGELTRHSLSPGGGAGVGIPIAFVADHGHSLVWEVANPLVFRAGLTTGQVKAVVLGQKGGTGEDLKNQRAPQWVSGASSLYSIGHLGWGDLGKRRTGEKKG